MEMRELFRIGHFSIHVFGVTIALGILVGLWIMMKEAKRKGLEADKILDLGIYTIIVSILGARLYYVIAFNLSYYIEHKKEIIMINNGGLSIQGALIAGTIFAIWYTGRKNIHFWKVADAFAPGIIIGQAIGRIGCDVFGIPMERIYPWGVMVNSRLLHPAQLYEAVLDLALFMYLWRVRGKIKYNGEIFIKYIIGFSVIRAAVEFFRTNPVVYGPFTIAHVTSFAIIIAAVAAGRIIRDRKENEGQISENDAVKVGLAEYLVILAGAAAGIWFYYYIN
jgi:phosphatidylglycerol:prolipoprotein diacylglycerol transferase